MTAASDPSVPLTSGLSDPEQPDRWLVPPWPQDASYCAVVGHFLRWQPRDSANAGTMLAYYEAFQGALERAPTHDVIWPADWAWAEDLRTCLSRSRSFYEAAQQTDRRATTTAQRPRGWQCQSSAVRTLPRAHGA